MEAPLDHNTPNTWLYSMGLSPHSLRRRDTTSRGMLAGTGKGNYEETHDIVMLGYPG